MLAYLNIIIKVLTLITTLLQTANSATFGLLWSSKQLVSDTKQKRDALRVLRQARTSPNTSQNRGAMRAVKLSVKYSAYVLWLSVAVLVVASGLESLGFLSPGIAVAIRTLLNAILTALGITVIQ